MQQLFILGVGLLAAWLFGGAVGDWLLARTEMSSDTTLWAGRIIAFLVGFTLARLVSTIRANAGQGGGGWGMVLRPVKGELATYLVFFVIAATVIGIAGPFFRPAPGEQSNAAVIVVVGFAMLAAWFLSTRAYGVIGELTRPLRRIARELKFGKGGSAAFGGLLSEWDTLWRPGSILLGQSAYGKDWRIGLHDDRHLLTIAGTRGGKGRSAIIPNLLTWPGSALVIDPKGTNAAVTAFRRGHGGGRVTKGMGQEVHVFDPFGVVAPLGLETAHFNPLAMLDPESERIAENIWSIADALVVAEPGAEHWDQSAHGLISGLIAHVISAEPMGRRTLGQVRALLGSARLFPTNDETSILEEMEANEGAAGLAARAAAQLMTAGDQERGSIVSTAMRHTRWLDSAPMKRVLSGDGFDLRDLKRKAMTVYVVIPPDELENHRRFLRLFINAGLTAMTQEPARPKDRILFLMDEFAALGRMDSVRVAMNVIASYRVMLWPIIQNLGQLRNLYGQDWQSFLDATGAVQVFSIGGDETGEFIANTLGEHMVSRNIRGQVSMALARLRTATELREDTDRDWRTQIVLRAGKQPLHIKRLMYDKAFDRTEYSPDPDHADKGMSAWLDKVEARLRSAR